ALLALALQRCQRHEWHGGRQDQSKKRSGLSHNGPPVDGNRNTPISVCLVPSTTHSVNFFVINTLQDPMSWSGMAPVTPLRQRVTFDLDIPVQMVNTDVWPKAQPLKPAQSRRDV